MSKYDRFVVFAIAMMPISVTVAAFAPVWCGVVCVLVLIVSWVVIALTGDSVDH